METNVLNDIETKPTQRILVLSNLRTIYIQNKKTKVS